MLKPWHLYIDNLTLFIVHKSAEKRKEDNMKTRNWIEETLKKEIAWSPYFVGWKNGRRLYTIRFNDGTEKDYFIDFDSKTIEEY